ncbi:polysaccharide biosynthesis tyrosine autokinase [Patulibacter sp. S7RM1-6]
MVVSLLQEERFQATSTVLINRQSVASQLSGTSDVGLQQQSFQQVLTTQAKLARTPTVLRSALAAAGRSTDTDSIDALRANSDVKSDSSSDLLTFSVVAERRQDARRIADEYANAFVSYRRELDTSALKRALDDVDRALAAADRAEGSGSLKDRLSSSRQELQTRLALQTANAQVVATAQVPDQVQPRPFRNLLLGLVIGAFLGVIAALARDALDTRVRTASELEANLEMPILSRVVRPKEVSPGRASLVMLEDDNGPSAEAFRILRNNLNFGLKANGIRVLLVTSSGASEGKSTTIANLAIAMALAGKRVALVDLDLRRPSLTSLFGQPAGPGLTSVAIGEAELDETLITIELSKDRTFAREGRLRLLPAGPLPPDPGEFVSTAAVAEIITRLREESDLVLIDAPPVLGVSDATEIATVADGVFVCARLGLVTRTTGPELARAVGKLPVPALGLVVTGAETDSSGSYYGYYNAVYASSAARLATESDQR